MKRWTLLIGLTVLIPLVVFGRFVQAYNNKTLIQKSQLVFIGKIKSIKQSGIKTRLSYPSWEQTVFEWLIADVEVVEPVKGAPKGDVVQTALLSVDNTSSPPMFDAPGMLKPEVGDMFLFCLSPTPLTNVFAAVTAPFDDDLSIFRLDRHEWDPSTYSEGMKDERVALIWSLVDDSGRIIPRGVQKLRKSYADEIRTKPTNDIVYLQWEARTNASGWIANFPKSQSDLTNTNGK
jgi:hypothetical protein